MRCSGDGHRSARTRHTTAFRASDSTFLTWEGARAVRFLLATARAAMGPAGEATHWIGSHLRHCAGQKLIPDTEPSVFRL